LLLLLTATTLCLGLFALRLLLLLLLAASTLVTHPLLLPPCPTHVNLLELRALGLLLLLLLLLLPERSRPPVGGLLLRGLLLLCLRWGVMQCPLCLWQRCRWQPP
jgi:hypothetical protein